MALFLKKNAWVKTTRFLKEFCTLKYIFTNKENNNKSRWFCLLMVRASMDILFQSFVSNKILLTPEQQMPALDGLEWYLLYYKIWKLKAGNWLIDGLFSWNYDLLGASSSTFLFLIEEKGFTLQVIWKIKRSAIT